MGWSAVSECIRDLCTHIFAQAVPTHDTMLMVVMLNALEREADHIRSEMTSYYVSNPNSTSAALSSHVEQEVLYKTRCETSSDSALAMRTAKNFRRTQKICTNPMCPHKIGHLYPDCHGPGGPMEGRRDEVIAKITKAKEERDKKAKVTGATTPSATGIHHDKSGRAYLLDSESGQAVFLASIQPQPLTPNVALATLTTDPIPRDWYNNMSTADQSEYEALFIEEHSASVNWRERRRAVASDAFLTSSPNYDSRSKLSSNAGPFILDSGATIHISPDTGDFFDLKPIPPRTIRGVGGASINATGIGKIRLHIADGHTITLDPALFVPEVAVRLMSVLVLGKGPQKLILHFDGDGCWLTNRFGTTIASGKLSNIRRQLYSIDIGTPLTKHGYFAMRVPDLETWHCRLGHVNYRSIVDMSDNQMTRGMHVDLSSAPPKCQSCILGKQTRSSVPKIREGPRASVVLDCIYIDLTGPQSVQSASRHSYVMNLIDDVTSYSWAIPLPLKSSAITALKSWCLVVERQTGKKIGIFNIDNGELKSTEFVNFCASKGISPRWTSPHTSAQNGRIERIHRTLFDSAQTMRSFAGLPPNRRDKFIVTANYLRRFVTTKTLNNITPYEAYSSHKPDVSHLHEIGCRAFVLIQNKHNPKVFERSEECVLIGYRKDSKSYRCYHRATHKVIESYHVVFIESKDDREMPFRPGVTQGLDEESIQIPLTSPDPIPNLHTSTPTSQPINPAPSADIDNPVVPVSTSLQISSNPIVTSSCPTVAASIPPHSPPPARRSSRIINPSLHSAEASGFQKISAVQRATLESIASKTCLDEEKQASQRSRQSSWNGSLASPQPDTLTPSSNLNAQHLHNALSAIDDLSDSQTTLIIEQLYGDGFEWGFSSADIDVTSPEEPCTFEEAMASPDAPKWLAACKDELRSIQELGVFRLVPRSTAANRTIMDGKFIFKLKRDQDGNIVRWKVRFVMKGYSAIYGINYNKTAAPSMQMEPSGPLHTLLPLMAGNCTKLTSKRLSFVANLNQRRRYT
jgi:hypothetical protein